MADENASTSPTPWSPASWKSKPNAQAVDYPDSDALKRALTVLAHRPPLVTSWEVCALKQMLAEAARGQRFLLHGGDCAETFADCRSEIIASMLKILLQMSLLMIHGGRKRVIRIGRLAGQYFSHRTRPVETRDGVTWPAYQGDGVNGVELNAAARVPDPERLIVAHARSAATLNFVRALMDGGFADLYSPENWELGFVDYSHRAQEYHRLVRALRTALTVMETHSGSRAPNLMRMDLYTSHAGLNLHYEQAQTRQVPRRPGWYDLSAHLQWVGHYTSDVDGAHVEFFRGIVNPIGLKIGPETTPERLGELLDVLDPHDDPGRLTLIHRFGVDHIAQHLPALIDEVRRRDRTVLWCCDPMHGNTRATEGGRRTRCFEDILGELSQAFDIHRDHGSLLGGVHLELTGENVTECIGGARGLNEAGLERAYRTFVHPRLNYEQSLEMSLLVGRRMAQDRR